MAVQPRLLLAQAQDLARHGPVVVRADVLADESAFQLVLRSEGELAGLPDFVRAAARQAAVERGVVIAARDLGKLKTWSQALAAALGGLAAAGVVRDDVAWWALLVALVLTWVSGLDYARSAPRVLRGRAAVSP